MKKVFLLFVLSAACGIGINAQTTAAPAAKPATTIAEKQSSPKPMTAAAPKKMRGPVFRPTKEQIKQAQAMLKLKNRYSGEATGTYNDDTRAGITGFQKENGIEENGKLDRATLEKMGIELTDSQKLLPPPEKSAAPIGEKTTAASGDKIKRGPVFKATKDQVNAAQKMLKTQSLYAGEETGKLDDATRESLKKFQGANDIKITGTLNQVTLEKMGIALTAQQKESSVKK